MLIGITGQIGSGKSTASEILKDFGAAIIDADKIGKQVVDSNPVLLKKLATKFGQDILKPNGHLNRKKLAQKAFLNSQAKNKLDLLVHPYLLKEIRKQIISYSKSHQLIVIDAALLLEWNLDKEVDMTIVVHASKETRFKRLKARGISNVDALARQSVQLPFSEFRKRADRIILNSKSKADLKRKLKNIFTK